MSRVFDESRRLIVNRWPRASRGNGVGRRKVGKAMKVRTFRARRSSGLVSKA